MQQQGEPKDLLFLSTERYHFCVLEYDAAAGEAVAGVGGCDSGSLGQRVWRPSQPGAHSARASSHRAGRWLVDEVWEGGTCTL